MSVGRLIPDYYIGSTEVGRYSTAIPHYYNERCLEIHMDRDIKEPNKSEEIARQLESKKQVVFYGPPGTGKTYVAQKFAKWWTGYQDVESPAQNRVQTVTFHPSFTYEDFIEGLSADSDDSGSVEYAIEDGILKRVSKRAREDYEAAEENEEPPRYVLVIDEINRGNVAQIFGETITLLEKDKRGTVSTQLAHSDESFTIPPNLYIIGTMNTADRSISLVDAALRRRFRFIPFAPEMETLSMYHGINNLKESAESGEDGYEVLLAMSILAVKQINERILNTPDLGKGKQIGHSYLMDLENTQGIVDTWKYDILPLLEEYYFSQFDRIRQDIFEGGGSELVDWESERIGDFDAKDLLDALEELVDLDASVIEIEEDSSNTNSGSSESYSKYPEALKEAQERIYPRVKDTLNAEDVTEVSNTESNLDHRRTLEFSSQDPHHPSGSELSYFLKPEPERNGQHSVYLNTLRDDNKIFEFITQNPGRYEKAGFEVTSPSDSNKRYRTVKKSYEIDDAEKGQGKEIVDELVQSKLFEKSIDDFVELVEITHELFRESDTDIAEEQNQ